MAAHGRGLVLNPVLCTVFFLILPPKTNNVWFASKSNSWFYGVHLYDSTFNWKCLKDLTKTWQKRPKSWLSETFWSCFTLWSVLLAVLAMFWDLTLTISDNLKRKGNVLDPFILGYKMSIYIYTQMLATYSYICLESQQNQIDVPSQRTFCFSFGCQPAKGIGNRCKSFTGGSLDPCNRCAPASSWFEDGISALVVPFPSTQTGPI